MEPRTLLHVFPSFAVGGQQTRFATIATGLGPSFRHVVVSLDGRAAARALVPASVTLRMHPTTTPSGIRWLGAQAREIRAIRPDALVTYNWGSIEWAMANRLFVGCAHIHFEDGFGPDEADRQLARRVVARRVVLGRSAIVVPSRTLAAIATGVWRLSPERVTYIPNGIDAERFDAVPDTSGLFDRGAAECVIGAVAPLRREKNLGRLLRAFSRLERAPRLVIVGDGPEMPALRALAGELGIGGRVTFTGHVRAPELVMGGFDVFAITSDTEQMPYAVLEAMCAGLPVAGTDVGDVATMVHDDNRRFVVPRDDPDRLVGALDALCADASLRRRVGVSNRAAARERFTLGRMVSAFSEILRATLSGD